jgi:PAS domain S-box-containing protein
MRRALSGQSGTVVGLDYRGEEVLAAHEPVAGLDLGIVAKIDLTEVRTPFLTTGAIAGSMGLLVVLAGAALFVRVSNPMIRRLEQHSAEMTEANVQLKQEIEERLKAEEEFRKFKFISDESNDAHFLLGRDSRFQYVNKAACNMMGYSESELLELCVSDVDAVYDLAKYQELFDLIHEETVAPVGTTNKRKDGSLFPSEITVTGYEIGGERYMFAALRDITERKQAEEATKLAYLELNQIFQTAGGGMRVVDKDFNVLRINQTFATLSGKTKAEAVGKKCYEGFPGPACHTSQCPLSRILGGVERAEYEAEKERFDGTKVPCIITATPFKGPSGELIGMVQDFKDITERKQAEEALKEAHEELEKRVRERTAELVRANEQLMREIEARKEADDRIRGLSQQLLNAQERERQRLSYELHDNLAQVLSAGKIAVDSLINSESEVQPDINQKVPEASKLLQQSIRIVREMAYNLRPASLDQFGLVQVVGEHCEEFFIKNAIVVDFYSAGVDEKTLDIDTKISIYRMIQESLNNVARHADASRVTLRLVASFPNLIVRIEDDGKGFDMERRLADAVREKRMGLHSMEQRASLLQGKLRIESRPMEGTKIIIEVPCKEEANGK